MDRSSPQKKVSDLYEVMLKVSGFLYNFASPDDLSHLREEEETEEEKMLEEMKKNYLENAKRQRQQKSGFSALDQYHKKSFFQSIKCSFLFLLTFYFFY